MATTNSTMLSQQLQKCDVLYEGTSHVHIGGTKKVANQA